MTVKHKNEETHMLRKTGRRLAVASCPLYEQVRNVLVERLRHGDWHPGDRLPTESVLAEELGVSLGTLRRAVELLVEEGALIRRQGAGTFAATLDGGRGEQVPALRKFGRQHAFRLQAARLA